MALPILDGNQSATTLSTILSSGQHITAHTVVSLGTQAITDIVNATSAGLTNTQLRASAVTVGGTVTVGNSLTISSLPAISGTVTAQTDLDTSTGQPCVVLGFGTPAGVSRVNYNNGFPVQILNTSGQINTSNPLAIFGTVTIGSALPAGTNRIGVVTIGAGTVTIGNDITLLGIQASGFISSVLDGAGIPVYPRDDSSANASFPIAGTVTIGSALPAGTNRIGVVTIGAGTVTLGAGTAQIGRVTASISGTVPVSISSVTVGNSVTISSLPALVAGTAQIGSVTASISNSVTIASLPAISGTVTANLAISSTAITSGSFASLTSATLVPGNVARKMATVYNLGAGQLFINAGATATTLGGGFMIALSSGDFYECPYTTTTLSAIFATAGTASWVSH